MRNLTSENIFFVSDFFDIIAHIKFDKHKYGWYNFLTNAYLKSIGTSDTLSDDRIKYFLGNGNILQDCRIKWLWTK